MFFPVVVAAYAATPERFRWILLLSASYAFYACWRCEYLVLIAGATLITYGCSFPMARAPSRRARVVYLVAAVGTNLGVLFGFKYFNFFNDSAGALFESLSLAYHVPALDVLLPVGISFYTFQALSYSIDVFHQKRPPEKHLGIFALYVSFFPQLVAGPIERSTRLLPQLHTHGPLRYEQVTSGLSLMLFGFFKKMVIADRLAVYVNAVYNQPELYGAAPLVLATYLFAFQIYCDFSGYSDIAIGAARVLGVDLTKNFNLPYRATSVADFWNRWHITLSSWFRDYLYIPLGGNRKGGKRWLANVAVVFLLSGLWHGASWTFVLWGAIHGLYLITAKTTSKLRGKISDLLGLRRILTLHKAVRILAVFHLVTFAWIFFRAGSLDDAVTILERIVSTDFIWSDLLLDTFGIYELKIAFASIVLLELIQHVDRRIYEKGLFFTKPTALRWALYYCLFFGILIFGKLDVVEFVYFQF